MWACTFTIVQRHMSCSWCSVSPLGGGTCIRESKVDVSTDSLQSCHALGAEKCKAKTAVQDWAHLAVGKSVLVTCGPQPWLHASHLRNWRRRKYWCPGISSNQLIQDYGAGLRQWVFFTQPTCSQDWQPVKSLVWFSAEAAVPWSPSSFRFPSPSPSPLPAPFIPTLSGNFHFKSTR